MLQLKYSDNLDNYVNIPNLLFNSLSDKLELTNLYVTCLH